MDNNTDEQKQRQQDLKTASTWLADAREWAKLAKQLHAETEPLPNNDPAAPNKLNVAHSCIANAFQLTYNALLVAEAKWPRENDNLEKSHRRLKNDTQNDIQTFIARAGFNDTASLLKDLDYYRHDYMAPPRQYYPDAAVAQVRNHESQIPSLAELLDDLAAFTEHKIAAAKTAAPSRKLTPEEAHVKVVKKVQEIVGAPHDGDYMYRGEPEHYDKVTSSLYRRYSRHIETDNIQTLNIGFAQDEILEEVKGYAEERTDFDVLTRLQHYGGKTNLIDFTTDCLVALFFACDGASDDDGRVVLLQKSKAIEKGHKIEPPRILENRVIAQKSIFVSPTNGYIEPELFESIPITEDLKGPMLDYLRKHHGISANTIYNDLHGYIKYQELHYGSYDAFFEGLKHHDNGRKSQRQGRGDDAEHELDAARRHYDRALEVNPQFATAYHHRAVVNRIQRRLDSAINDSSCAIELNSDYVDAYFTRGLAYYDKLEHELAAQDFTHAINLDRNHREAYCNRAFAYLHMKNWDGAKTDLTTAENMGIDLAAARGERYPTNSGLEESIGVKLPEDIANMLVHTQSPSNTSN